MPVMSAKPIPQPVFDPEFEADLRCWVETDRKVALRLLTMVAAVVREPSAGICKPEPLHYELRGAWSRRLTPEHRLGYAVIAGRVHFLQRRYHYTR